jgi:hypothetical protein
MYAGIRQGELGRSSTLPHCRFRVWTKVWNSDAPHKPLLLTYLLHTHSLPHFHTVFAFLDPPMPAPAICAPEGLSTPKKCGSVERRP